ncbi:MAG: WecB/TagA/CpsF family glycosyltransferase [Oscillospiraceae bacterium]|jgi:N-acetylglucosaminyldiphosphoundecaprenol N-acetyl-beta-D-mannosaminyltransferase|nr:WecB/TagA/CpsF family glycosyltransferase [Oscillospiraceae bacterium]
MPARVDSNDSIAGIDRIDRIDILGIPFDSRTRASAADAAMELISAPGADVPFIVTPNPEIVRLAGKNPRLREAVLAAALVLPDGVGITLAARILGRPLAERTPGIDVAELVLERLAKIGGSVYLLGAKPGVAERAGARLCEKYSGLILAGARDGYFTDDAAVIADINAASPELLLVCLGSPKQELWAYDNRAALKTRLMACLGGSLDVFAGDVRRAPPVFRRLGLEWLYRLAREPRRIFRMAALPLFMLTVLREKIAPRGGGKKEARE